MKYAAIRSILHEPLIRFILIGLVVFAVDKSLRDDAPAGQVISIDRRVKSELVQQFKSQMRRDPSDSELDKIIETWLQSELLYRKGLALGLDRSDPQIRDRIIKKTRFLFENLAKTDEPNEQELRQWYAGRANDYKRSPRYDFEQVLIRDGNAASAHERAESILQQLLTEKSTRDFGEDYHKFIGRNGSGLQVIYGRKFVETLDSLPNNKWQLIQSRKGWHVIRRLVKYEEPLPPFEKIKPLLRADWYKQKQREYVTKLIEELRSSFTIERDST